MRPLVYHEEATFAGMFVAALFYTLGGLLSGNSLQSGFGGFLGLAVLSRLLYPQAGLRDLAKRIPHDPERGGALARVFCRSARNVLRTSRSTLTAGLLNVSMVALLAEGIAHNQPAYIVAALLGMTGNVVLGGSEAHDRDPVSEGSARVGALLERESAKMDIETRPTGLEGLWRRLFGLDRANDNAPPAPSDAQGEQPDARAA